jgi:Zn-dependent protease
MFNDREIKLGKVFGIQIGLDYSWFWVLLLVSYTFIAQLLPSLSPMEPVWRYFIYGFFAAFLFFASVLGHELAHSLVARAQGDKIDKITLFLFGGVANLEEEPKSAKNEIKMAIVGPLTSGLIGILLLIFSYLFDLLGFLDIFTTSLAAVGYINFFLAAFNLLPGFPLDGGRIFRGIIWLINDDLIRATKVAVVGGKIVAGALIVYGIFQIVALGALGGLWLILIGFFLYQAAKNSLIRTIASFKLKELTVSDIVFLEPLTIDSSAPATKVMKMFRKYRRDFILVCQKQQAVGVIGRKDILNQSVEVVGEEFLAEDLAVELEKYETVSQDLSAEKLINKLINANDHLLLIEKENKIINYISLLDLRNYLESCNLLEG